MDTNFVLGTHLLEILGDNIKAHRRLKYADIGGGNASVAAKELGISSEAFAQWERGDTMPGYNNICKLAEFFGITQLELFLPPGTLLAPAVASMKEDMMIQRAQIQLLKDQLKETQEENFRLRKRLGE